MSLTATRVLIVEDDATIRSMLERVLSRGGYLVSTAAEGHEALRILEAEPPDLLVLDLMLPWVNGIQLLTTIRQRAPLARMPVLVTTGTATSAYDLRDFAPVWVLHKPFELSSVLPAAEKLLNKANS